MIALPRRTSPRGVLRGRPEVYERLAAQRDHQGKIAQPLSAARPGCLSQEEGRWMNAAGALWGRLASW